MPARPRGCCINHNRLTTHFAGWLCTPRLSLRLAGARRSPDRVGNANTMLGDAPDTGHTDDPYSRQTMGLLMN